MSQGYDESKLEENEDECNLRYSIYGNKIWIQEKQDFIEGYIFVDGEIIVEIIQSHIGKEKQIEQLQDEYPQLYNYHNLYIFPGLVDINVSLHLGSDWEEIEQTTELFMKGGVTTIACQPLITNHQFLNDEVASIRNKKDRMYQKSSVDYCFLAHLYPQNIHQIQDLYYESGVAGFKIYLTPPFQNGAGWVETRKEMDSIMKKINELRLNIENEEQSPTTSKEKKDAKYQFQQSPKSLLVTFHSIKSGDKELTITSPLRQRRIEDRCDKTTQIKRTQGDSILGETHKVQKNLEINNDNDDQFDNLTMGQISECINDNILNLKHDRDTSDEEINQSDMNGDIDENNQQNPFKEQVEESDSPKIDHHHASSQSNREKFIKMYAKATINSTENLQIKLIARAEMQTYAQGDNKKDSDDEQENSISSSFSENSEDKDSEEKKEINNNHNIKQLDDIQNYEQDKLEKSTSFCSPMSSRSSNRFESYSPMSELCQKDRRKESQESADLDQQLIPFPTQNSATYAYDIEGLNETSIKNQGKFIKMHKVQQEDICNTSQIKDDDKQVSLHKIDENADSAQDSNSDYEEDNSSINTSCLQNKLHKKSYNEPFQRSGSPCAHYSYTQKAASQQAYNSKRGSHDVPIILHTSETPQLKLIKDMKRGSCDKETPSFLNDHTHHFKKSNFNMKDENKQASSMGEINKKEGIIASSPEKLTTIATPQLLQIPNKMRFSEKRKSMNLVVQVENKKINRLENAINHKFHIYNPSEEQDTNQQENIFTLKSSGLISDEPTSLKDITDKQHSHNVESNSSNNNGQIENNNKQNQNQNHLHQHTFHHSNTTTNINMDVKNDDQLLDNQIFGNNNCKEEFSTRKQSSDSGSTPSIGNHILNQSSSSIAPCGGGGNLMTQSNFNNQNQCFCSQCQNQNYYQHQTQNKSKFNQDYLTFLAFRPPYWEYFGIQLIRDSLEKTSTTSKVKLKVVFANIGNSNSMYRITILKQDLKKKTSNIHLYSETTAAYLFFSSNKIPNGQTIFKCEPPIGVRENKEFLINASKLNMVDVVSSYHFPVEERFKCIEEGDFRKAFSGICTAGFTLQSTWTALYQSYKNSKHKSLNIKKDNSIFEEEQKTQVLLKYLVNMLSKKPAKIMNINHMKGSIQKGKYADFVVWDPFSSCQRIKIPPSYRFKSVHIFDQKKIYGLVHATFIRGQIVYDKNNNKVIKGQGKLISKNGVL